MRFLRPVLFVVFVVGTGFAIGLLSAPGNWYSALAKPWFNPPNWIFAPAWLINYFMVALAGSRTYERDSSSTAMSLWWGQMALNFSWSPIFFATHSPKVALAVILLLFATILWFIARQWSRDRTAAVLFVPYAMWVGFASILNAEIVRLN
jgi:translocator protein